MVQATARCAALLRRHRRCARRPALRRPAERGSAGATSPIAPYAAGAARRRPPAEADAKSAGCMSCHTATDRQTMHENPAVMLGCTDCHGGDAAVQRAGRGARPSDAGVPRRGEQAHVLPRYPERWNCPVSANPRAQPTRCSTARRPEFVRFVNPGDLRVAREACGACHLPIIQAAERSLHGDLRDALGRRRVQQRHPAVQALHPRRGLHARRRAARCCETPVEPDRRSMKARGVLPRLAAAAGVGDDAARRRLPRVRARRARHRQPVPRDRPARTLGPDPAPRRAGPSRHPPVEPRRRAPACASRCRCSTSPRRA